MAEEQNEKPSRDLGKILSLLFIVANALVLAGGSYLTYAGTLGYQPPSLSENQAQSELEEFRKTLQSQPVLFAMEPFNTNLDGVPRRLIRVNLNLEMLDEEGFEEVMGLGAEARDSIVRILNSKKFDDIETVQGKLRLKTQIATALNGFLDRGVVKNVYFTEFAIQ